MFNSSMKFNNKKVQKLALNLKKMYGVPHNTTKDAVGNTLSAHWKNINGLDGVIINNEVKYKWHPYPAPVFVYSYKYLHVPELLIGPLKYASETIKIDEIDIPYKHAKVYHKTGQKKIAKVFGSCASVVIGAITIKFVEDMCLKYKNTKMIDIHTLYHQFRSEYDNRIKIYIDTHKLQPKIPWLKTDQI